MKNKLTQEQIDARTRMYNEAIDKLLLFAQGWKEGDHEQAAAVIKELRGNLKRFLQRMEGGKVGRKGIVKGGNDFNYDNWNDDGNWERDS